MVGRSRMGLLFIADNNGVIKVAGGLWTKYLPFVVFMDIFFRNCRNDIFIRRICKNKTDVNTFYYLAKNMLI